MPADADANRRSLATLGADARRGATDLRPPSRGRDPRPAVGRLRDGLQRRRHARAPGRPRDDGVRAVRALRAPARNLGRATGRAPRGRSWRRIEEYAPGFSGTIEAAQVLTPLDLERTYGLTEGNIFHGDLNIGQLFSMRPMPAWSRYRTPIEGLYLCGAGAHPGGGVTGAPGYGASHAALRDLRAGRRTGLVALKVPCPNCGWRPSTEFAWGGELGRSTRPTWSPTSSGSSCRRTPRARRTSAGSISSGAGAGSR